MIDLSLCAKHCTLHVGKFQRKRIPILAVRRGGVEGGPTLLDQSSTFKCAGQVMHGAGHAGQARLQVFSTLLKPQALLTETQTPGGGP